MVDYGPFTEMPWYAADRRVKDRSAIKHTELVERMYVGKYFSGMWSIDPIVCICKLDQFLVDTGKRPEERATERMRASAWYCYAYQRRKRKFAWLGARYLNEIRRGQSYSRQW